MTWKILSILGIALPLCAALCPALAQDDIRNAEDFTDEEYKRFQKTLIDRPAWEQLQADFLVWKQQYPLRYSDSPTLHLIEGIPIVSLQVGQEKAPEIEENRRAGIVRICKLVFKNKRYDELQITLMNRERPELTQNLTLFKDAFLDHYRERQIAHKLPPSQKQSIEERHQIFQALHDRSLQSESPGSQ